MIVLTPAVITTNEKEEEKVDKMGLIKLQDSSTNEDIILKETKRTKDINFIVPKKDNQVEETATIQNEEESKT